MKAANADVAAEILKSLLVLSKTGTMRSIYERIAPAPDGAIHSDQSPYGTETSRFSHSETFLFQPGSTNLANLPKKTASEKLYSVRDCIVPRPGKCFIKADYSAAEARWCAYIANDTKRIRMYEAGIDQYKYFVAVLNWNDGERWKEVPKMLRNAIGKVGILSGQYGVSWRTLLDTVNAEADLTGIAINAATAKRMEAIWPEFFPETVQWHARVRDQVVTEGYIDNPFGWRRAFFARKDSESALAGVVREAIAFAPQSANATLLNQSLRKLYTLHDPGLLQVLLQVHDEIVLECYLKDICKVTRIVKDIFETPVLVNGATITIPTEIEVCKTSWSKAKKIA